jgi:hypothetical protein
VKYYFVNILTKLFFQLTTSDVQGGDEEGGGGSDIGSLLANLAPLSGSLSGVSFLSGGSVQIFSFRYLKMVSFFKFKVKRTKTRQLLRSYYAI